MNKKSVIIVGAGIGALATALRLVKRGYKVQIVEKNNSAGGRLNQLKKDGFIFDIGPSFFSMPYEFEELADDCNIDLPFEILELDPLYTVSYRGNNRKFSLYKDVSQLAEQFVEFEPDFKEKFEKYIKKSEALFHDTVPKVVKRNFNSKLDYFKSLLKVNPIHIPMLPKTFWKHIKSHFKSKEAREILSLVSFFLGRTPFDTNAVFTLLSYTEFRNNGYYNVKGGMYKIVEGLVKELEREHVEITYNTEIVSYQEKDGELLALIDQDGNLWRSDMYVINSDAAWFRGKVLKRPEYSDEKLKKKSWTMGYLTFYLGLKTKLPEVEYHNYYLGDNYQNYSLNVLKNPEVLEKPYYYVNVVSKHNPECAPDGHEALFCVCPVPNLLVKNNWEDKDKIVDSIIEDFSLRIGRNIKPEIVSRTVYTPETWQNKFNLFRGAGLGLSHNMNQIGGYRPANFDEKYSNVFYVGSSTIPGAGIPMSVISSKLVTQRIIKN